MNKKTIIVLEDNPEILKVIELILESKLLRIIGCTTIKCFRSEIEKEMPDLILIDIKLPDGNGLDICKQIKDDPDTRHIPVMMLSGYHGMETGDKCYPDAYMEKPFDMEVFTQKVDRLLNLRSGYS